MKLLDLFCCAGGAAMGYYQAGFTVIGVDILPQPHFPFRFTQGDAISILASLIDTGRIKAFDAVHASPPCQAYSHTQRIRDNDHPDLIAETRRLLSATGLPYVIENVEGAPLRDPIMLCGAMFPSLRVYRHRLFETSFPVQQPQHPAHTHKQAKMGRPPKPDEFMHVVGNFSGVAAARTAMGMPWATRDTLREAIPPAYAEYVGRQLASHINNIKEDAVHA